MQRKIRHFPLTASILSASLLFTAACSNGNTTEDKAEHNDKIDQVVVEIFHGKVEVADQLKALTDLYTKEHPNVAFDIQTVGGGADSTAALKAKFASGSAPDIFTLQGYQDVQTWTGKLEDLTDQPWIKDAYEHALLPVTVDGKVYGQPVNLEGYGFAYNKELFKKTGITELPKTLSKLEEAAKKLKAAGIIPFATGYGEWWVLGNHGLNIPFSTQEDPDAFIKGLNEGTAKMEGNKHFEQYLSLLDLTVKYGNENPLTTDYNTQVTLFATGEAAMIQQGNWIQPMIDKLAPNMDVGFLPMPLGNDRAAADKLAVGVPSNWVIHREAPDADKQAAKDFLNWIVTSEEGKRAMVEEFKYIPAFAAIDAKAEHIGPLGAELLKYSEAGKTFSWQFMKYPDGAGPDFGAILQQYVGGQVSKEDALKALDSSWVKFTK